MSLILNLNNKHPRELYLREGRRDSFNYFEGDDELVDTDLIHQTKFEEEDVFSLKGAIREEFLYGRFKYQDGYLPTGLGKDNFQFIDAEYMVFPDKKPTEHDADFKLFPCKQTLIHFPL